MPCAVMLLQATGITGTVRGVRIRACLRDDMLREPFAAVLRLVGGIIVPEGRKSSCLLEGCRAAGALHGDVAGRREG